MTAVAVADASGPLRERYGSGRHRGVFRGWLPMLTVPPAVVLLWPDASPRWALMWMLAFALYGSCKWVTWRRSTVTAPSSRQLAYLVAWSGMNADRFLSKGKVARPARAEVIAAVMKCVAGLLVYLFVARAALSLHPLLAGWVGMTGVVLMLHFGVFHLLSCLWRSRGIEAEPLMDRPLAATSITDFWSRRWNRAFRDLTHRFVFRPLCHVTGRRLAVFLSFVLSGIVHDLVISVPAGGGFGGPTAFFVCQGAAVLLERSGPGRRAGLDRGWRGRTFAVVALLAPVWMLFHPPFVYRIVLPLMHVTGAL